MSISCGGFVCGLSGTFLKKAPARTGESTSVVSGTGLKRIVGPSSEATDRALPCCHPGGSVRLAA